MQVLKRKQFARWQYKEHISDASLLRLVDEIEAGLIGVYLGSDLYKKRIARRGEGKRSGHRVLLAARVGFRYVFLFGFSKSTQHNISADEQKALQYVGTVFLQLNSPALQLALSSGVLMEVGREQ